MKKESNLTPTLQNGANRMGFDQYEPVVEQHPGWVTLLVAWDDERLIGRGTELPWKIPRDLKLFKERTKGQTIIMGLKTYNGLPQKPLHGRWNVIVTFPDETVDIPNVLPRDTSISVANDLKGPIAESHVICPRNEIFICGGASIYKQALEQNLVTRMLVSVIPGIHEGDVHFPEFPGVWERTVIEKYNEFVVEEWTREEK